MPTIDPTSPRMSRNYAGVSIQVPAPYSAGHALTASEAAFLNSAIATAVGNSFAGDARRAKDAGKDFTPTQELFDAKYTAYAVGESNRGGDSTPADPTEKFAFGIASAKVKELLVAKGKKVGDVMKAKDAEGNSVFHKLVNSYMEANEWVRALAAQQVAALAAAGTGDETDDLDLSEVA